MPEYRGYQQSDDFIIEKYMSREGDTGICYLVIDGEPYFVRTEDRCLGSEQNGLERLAVEQIFPSERFACLLEQIDCAIRNLIKSTDLRNASVIFAASWSLYIGLVIFLCRPGNDQDREEWLKMQ